MAHSIAFAQVGEDVNDLKKKLTQVENDLTRFKSDLVNANKELEDKEKALTNVIQSLTQIHTTRKHWSQLSLSKIQLDTLKNATWHFPRLIIKNIRPIIIKNTCEAVVLRNVGNRSYFYLLI